MSARAPALVCVCSLAVRGARDLSSSAIECNVHFRCSFGGEHRAAQGGFSGVFGWGLFVITLTHDGFIQHNIHHSGLCSW